MRGEEGKHLLTACSPKQRALGFGPVSGSATDISHGPHAPAGLGRANPSSSLSPRNPPPLSTCSGLSLLRPKPWTACGSAPRSTPQSRRGISPLPPPPTAALVHAITFLLDSCAASLLASLGPPHPCLPKGNPPGCPSKPQIRSCHSAQSPLVPPTHPPRSDV